MKKCVGCPFENGCKGDCEPTWRAGVDELLANPSVRFWLKDALRSALERDPVDAWADAHVLEGILNARMESSLNR